MTYVVPLCARKLFFPCLKNYLTAAETRTGLKVKAIRADGALEYSSNSMKELCSKKGIDLNILPRYLHQLNGKVERFNRTITGMAKAMLKNAQLGLEFWPEAVEAAAYIKNRTVGLSKRDGRTPYEIWYKQKPDLSYLRVFGSTAFVTLPPEVRKKLDDNAVECVLLGYSNGKNYNFCVKSSGQRIVGRDSIFLLDVVGFEKADSEQRNSNSFDMGWDFVEDPVDHEDDYKDEKEASDAEEDEVLHETWTRSNLRRLPRTILRTLLLNPMDQDALLVNPNRFSDPTTLPLTRSVW